MSEAIQANTNAVHAAVRTPNKATVQDVRSLKERISKTFNAIVGAGFEFFTKASNTIQWKLWRTFSPDAKDGYSYSFASKEYLPRFFRP